MSNNTNTQILEQYYEQGIALGMEPDEAYEYALQALDVEEPTAQKEPEGR